MIQARAVLPVLKMLDHRVLLRNEGLAIELRITRLRESFSQRVSVLPVVARIGSG